MKNIFKILSLAALLSVNSAFAITPENGWWWNPQEPGRGFNIETQGNTVFIATFIYDEKGNPIWYSGSGVLGSGGGVQIRLLRYDGGQCIGCDYQKPTTTDTQETIFIQFKTDMTAVLQWAGQNLNISRLNFGYGLGANALKGEWVIISTLPTSSDSYFGTRVTLNHAENNYHISGSITGLPIYQVKVAGPGAGGFDYFMEIVDTDGVSGYYGFNLIGLNKMVGLETLVNSKADDDTKWSILRSNGKPFEAYRAK